MMVIEFPNSDVYLQLAKAKEQNMMLLADLQEYENKYKQAESNCSKLSNQIKEKEREIKSL